MAGRLGGGPRAWSTSRLTKREKHQLQNLKHPHRQGRAGVPGYPARFLRAYICQGDKRVLSLSGPIEAVIAARPIGTSTRLIGQRRGPHVFQANLGRPVTVFPYFGEPTQLLRRKHLLTRWSGGRWRVPRAGAGSRGFSRRGRRSCCPGQQCPRCVSTSTTAGGGAPSRPSTGPADCPPQRHHNALGSVAARPGVPAQGHHRTVQSAGHALGQSSPRTASVSGSAWLSGGRGCRFARHRPAWPRGPARSSHVRRTGSASCPGWCWSRRLPGRIWAPCSRSRTVTDVGGS